jgi:hypothetical protein
MAVEGARRLSSGEKLFPICDHELSFEYRPVLYILRVRPGEGRLPSPRGVQRNSALGVSQRVL